MEESLLSGIHTDTDAHAHLLSVRTYLIALNDVELTLALNLPPINSMHVHTLYFFSRENNVVFMCVVEKARLMCIL